MLRKLLKFLIPLVILGLGIAYWGYTQIFTPNTNFSEESYLFKIPPKSGYEDIKALLIEQKVIEDISSFDFVAGLMKYKRDRVLDGNYKLLKGWNNRALINKLRSGIQEPVDVVFNNVRTLDELSGAISRNLALDSIELSSVLHDSNTFQKLGYTKENFISMFIPNTYKVFWDISEDQLLDRMKKESDAFWNKKNRKAKAKEQSLTPQEVYTLASIVEKESQHGPERPIIAGLYLNRLKKGIHLQADPTVVFANGDFELRRVLNKHLALDSPYNTYLYPGLPPGPIYMPSIESIDAVLNPAIHDYIFMCAKPGFGTQHAFAKTLRGHNKNANEYRRWLSSQGIR